MNVGATEKNMKTSLSHAQASNSGRFSVCCS